MLKAQALSTRGCIVNLHRPTMSCTERKHEDSGLGFRVQGLGFSTTLPCHVQRARHEDYERDTEVQRVLPAARGLTLAHFTAQLEDLGNTSLNLELNLSTFGIRPRVNLGFMGDTISLS